MKLTFLLLSLLALFGSTQAQDYLINRHVSNYPHEENITMDGYYWSDPFWTGSVSIPRMSASGNITIPATDNRFDFAATYDNNYLYVVVIVKETYAWNQTQTWFQDDSPANTPWEDDAVEIFIDPKNGYPLFQAIISHKADFNAPPELWINSNYTATGILFETAFQTGTKYISEYQVEVAIPWSKLGITPRSGLQFGFDIAVDDDDNGGTRDGQIAWKGTANNWNSTANYGLVKLQAAMYGVGYVNYYLGPPIIDGEVLHDPAYSPMPVAGITKKVIGNSNNEVNVRMTWDNNYLYVALVVWDNQGYTNTLYNDSPEIWNDDAIEIFIDPQNNKLSSFNTSLHRQILVQYSTENVPPEVSIRGNSAGIIAASRLVYSKIYLGGYSTEVAIPWTNLGIVPTVGKYIGFDISVDDDDNGGNRDSQLAWKGTVDNWQNPSVWGTIQLMYNGYSNDPATTRKAEEAAALEAAYVETACYPNPMKDQLTIQLDQAAAQVKIMDIHGRALMSSNVEGMNFLMVNTSSFGSGLYLVSVMDVNGKVETFKVTK